MSQEELNSSVQDLNIQESSEQEVSPPEENDTVEDIINTNQDQHEQAVQIETEQVENDDDEEEDDDFGAFSDASFDEFESQPEPQEPSTPTTTTTPIYTPLPQSQFDSPSQLQETLNTLLSKSFPDTLPPSSVPQNTNVLNERSELLLERLTALPYLKPHNWKKSSLRRQLLITLGIPDIETSKTRNKRNLDDGMRYHIVSLEELGMSEVEANRLKEQSNEIIERLGKCVKDDDVLKGMSEAELDAVLDDYSKKIEEISNLLAVWENEQKKLENDNSTFEGVVENLVGHTQRLRREETLKILKKEGQKSKGLGSMFKKKSKK